MFCSECKCEFVGWSDRCPCCSLPLIEKIEPDSRVIGKSVPYETLVDLVVKQGGRMDIEMWTTEVNRQKKLAFPYLGYGYAWVKRMHGSVNGIPIDIQTTEVGMDKTWRFPYQGYGFAWEKKMQGEFGGNQITLTAVKVAREKKWGFPYLGYGYAWTEEFFGECGANLKAVLLPTEISREKGWIFPYFAFGYAWAGKGTLRLSIIE